MTTKTPTDILRGKTDVLAAFRECGCLSVCVREDLSDPKSMGEFHATAAKRKQAVVRVKPGETWETECEMHRRERLARKETRSLFDA